jgi:hypothetical protein
MWNWLKKLLKSDYEFRLENYVNSHYPQNCADIERLVEEFNRKAIQSWR